MTVTKANSGVLSETLGALLEHRWLHQHLPWSRTPLRATKLKFALLGGARAETSTL